MRPFCLFSLILLILAAAVSAKPAPKADPGAEAIYAALVGQWTGTLEYRDYQTNKRVKLPTTLIVTRLPGGGLRYSYVYNDGPGKTVTESENVTIDAPAATYSVLGDGDPKPSVFHTAGLAAFTKARGGTLLLTGMGLDNNKPAEFRKTLTLTATTLTILKEVRPSGGTFQFRNQYTFTRLLKTGGSGL